MPRFLRYLRIAFSAVCGIACVLLVVLWIRSYQRQTTKGSRGDRITHLNSKKRLFAIGTQTGAIYLSLAHHDVRGPGRNGGWTVNYPDSRVLGFGAYVNPLSKTLRIPLWFLTLLASLFAAAPWLHKLPRRFSLRTLLIATTLVAVVLGAIVYFAR